MKLEIKNSLIIVSTLLLGIIIGFLVSGRLTKVRMEKMKSSFIEDGFSRQLMRTLKPSEEQLKAMRPIMDKFAKIRREKFKDHRAEQSKIFDDFEDELKPILSDDQIERLEEMKEKFNDKFPQNRGEGPRKYKESNKKKRNRN